MFRKGLDLEVRTIFRNPDGKLVVPMGEGDAKFLKKILEVFLGMSRSLMLEADWNGLLDARLDRMGLADGRMGGVGKSFRNLFRHFQLAYSYRLNFSNAPMWTWVNHVGYSKIL